MTRKARCQVLYNGCFAHVFSRSLHKQRIFQSNKDFEWFKNLLLRTKQNYRFFIHHYCVMHTHFHLAVSVPSTASFSRGLRELKWCYSNYYNRKARQEGPIWRERFKSLVIEDEAYLYACGLYIEGNPVHAGMVEKPEDWVHSSARHYFCGKSDPLVDSYENHGLPPGNDLPSQKAFTKGDAIGSRLFCLQTSQGAFREPPVP